MEHSSDHKNHIIIQMLRMHIKPEDGPDSPIHRYSVQSKVQVKTFFLVAYHNCLGSSDADQMSCNRCRIAYQWRSKIISGYCFQDGQDDSICVNYFWAGRGNSASSRHCTTKTMRQIRHMQPDKTLARW